MAPILSYRGRVLIVNNVCASMLWHKVMCMTIDDSVIKEIQKLCVTFLAKTNIGYQNIIYIYRLMMVVRV